MKKAALVIVILGTFISCINKSQPSNIGNDDSKNLIDSSESAIIEQNYKRPYFEYDAIDHYFLDINKSSVNDLYLKINPNPKEKELKQILHDGKTIDTNKLKEFGFQKSIWEDYKLKVAREIFKENGNEWYAASCIAVYRDVYIFKSKGKVVGTAKVCFECRQFIIEGTLANTDNFGQGGDFEKLLEISR